MTIYNQDASILGDLTVNPSNGAGSILTMSVTNVVTFRTPSEILVDINAAGLGDDVNFNSVQLLGGIGTQGTFSWNVDEETVDLIQDGTTLQLGQETQYQIRNNSGVTINDGEAVMATGTIGASGRITVSKYVNDGSIKPDYFIGIATETILHDTDGKVTNFGKIRGIQTDGVNYGEVWVDGDLIYLNPITPGGLTKVQPTAIGGSVYKAPIAIVVNSHASNGTLFVRVTGNEGIHELHDVQVTGISNLDVLRWNSANLRYENTTSSNWDTAFSWGDHNLINPPFKETVSTGIVSGGALSINGVDNTKFDVAAGSGYIVDITTSPATVTEVTWGAFSSQTLVNLATSFATDIAIDINGNIVQQNSFTDVERRNLIFLGGLDHSNQINILSTFSIQVPMSSPASSISELSRAIGDINISGNVYAPNGANLSLDKSGGVVFSYGRNTVNDKENPHKITVGAKVVESFGYVFNNGSGIGTFTTPVTSINPNNYDDGTGILAVTPTNKWTIQRLLFFPNDDKTFVQYGTAVYNREEDALNAVPRADFPALAGIRTAMVRGYIIVKQGETDLTSTDTDFLTADKFGTVAGLDGGSSLITWGNITGTLSNQIDLQSALDGKSNVGHTHLIADITDFTDNSTNWNTAFGWGDHALAGYSTQTLALGTDNQIPFVNAGGTDFEYNSNFIFDGNTLILSDASNRAIFLENTVGGSTATYRNYNLVFDGATNIMTLNSNYLELNNGSWSTQISFRSPTAPRSFIIPDATGYAALKVNSVSADEFGVITLTPSDIGAQTSGNYLLDTTDTFTGTLTIDGASSLNIGVNDTTAGLISVFGNSATTGGETRFYNGATADTNIDYYYLRASGDTFTIGDNNFNGGSIDISTTGVALYASAGGPPSLSINSNGLFVGDTSNYTVIDTSGDVSVNNFLIRIGDSGAGGNGNYFSYSQATGVLNVVGKTESDALNITGLGATLPTATWFENFAVSLGDFTSSGDAVWTRVIDDGNGDLFSARSGAIGHREYSKLTVTKTTTHYSSYLQYDYKTSTEADYDYLNVYVDGVIQKQYSGTNAWTTDGIFIFGIGSHTIDFVYYKDNNTIGGTDQVWIDNVGLYNNVNPDVEIDITPVFKDEVHIDNNLLVNDAIYTNNSYFTGRLQGYSATGAKTFNVNASSGAIQQFIGTGEIFNSQTASLTQLDFTLYRPDTQTEIFKYGWDSVNAPGGYFQMGNAAAIVTIGQFYLGATETFTVNGTSRLISTVYMDSIAAEATDVDKFLVSNAGEIKYRTGAQILSDIGAQASGNYLLDTTDTFTGTLTINGASSLNIGVDDTTAGLISLFGNSTTTGGEIRFYDGASNDTTNNYWFAKAISGQMQLKGSGASGSVVLGSTSASIRDSNSGTIILASTGGSYISDPSGDGIFSTTGQAGSNTFVFKVGDVDGALNGNQISYTQSTGILTINTQTAATVDTDKFMVFDTGGTVKYRTGAQVLSDIGAASSSSIQDWLRADIADTKEGALTLNATAGNLETNWSVDGAAVDEKEWDFVLTTGGAWSFRAVNDANSVATTIISVNRTGTTIDDVTIGGTYVQTSGLLWAGGAITGQSGSGAKLQVDGFQRTGNIYLHSGGLTPTGTRAADYLSNTDSGTLQWTRSGINTGTIWHSGNDGTGSGLDADLWDGKQLPTGFASTSNPYTIVATGTWDLPVGGAYFTQAGSAGGPGIPGYWFVTGRRDSSGGYSGIFTSYSGGASYIGHSNTDTDPTWYKIWTDNNDGSGSGLDADLLDGQHGSYYAPASTVYTETEADDRFSKAEPGANIFASPPDGTTYYAKVATWEHTNSYSHFHSVFKITNRYQIYKFNVETSVGLTSTTSPTVIIREDNNWSTDYGNGDIRVIYDTSSGTKTVFELWIKVAGWSGNNYGELEDYHFHSGSMTTFVWSPDDSDTNPTMPAGVSGQADNTGTFAIGGNGAFGGSVYSGGQYFIFGASTGEGEYLYRTGNDIRIYAGGSAVFTADGDNNRVGINNISPSYSLDVSGTGRYTDELLISAGNQPNSRLTLNNTASTSNRKFSLVAGINSIGQDGFSIYDSIAAATRFVVHNSGNVSIANTTDSGYKLDVTGSVRFTGDVYIGGDNIIMSTGQQRVKYSVWSDATTYGIGMASTYTYGGLNDYAMTFQMNNTANRGWWWGHSADTNGQGSMALTNAGLLTVASYTRIGYGKSDTTTPGSTYMLQVNGTIQASDFIGSSDERLKENIKIFNPKKIESTYKTFNFIKDEKKQERIGVIAQELEVNHPEFVRTDESGEKSVSYSDLHSAEIAYLKAENEELKRKIELIMNKLGI